MTDEDVPAFWQKLGLPGLIDLHVHVMPPRLHDAVWAYFDSVGPLLGRPWPIAYRWPLDRRLEHLRGLGVRAFPTLLYPHKPEMAANLNSWARDFAAEQRAAGHDDVIQTATFFAEDGVEKYVGQALDRRRPDDEGARPGGRVRPARRAARPGLGMLADAATPVVVHTGSGPAPGAFTGPGPFGEVLARHPRLTAIIAHLGMPEYDAFLGFAESYERVYVDTTMVFVDFFTGADEQIALARRLAPRLKALQDKVVLGSDFPNIPHLYAHQLEALSRPGLDDDWLRAVCWHNGRRLLDG